MAQNDPLHPWCQHAPTVEDAQSVCVPLNGQAYIWWYTWQSNTIVKGMGIPHTHTSKKVWKNRLVWSLDHKTWEGSLWRTTAKRNSLYWWIPLALCTGFLGACQLFLQPANHPQPIQFLLEICVMGNRATERTFECGQSILNFGRLFKFTRLILASWGLKGFWIIKTWTQQNAFKSWANNGLQWVVVQEASQWESMDPEGPLPVGNCIINVLFGPGFSRS